MTYFKVLFCKFYTQSEENLDNFHSKYLEYEPGYFQLRNKLMFITLLYSFVLNESRISSSWIPFFSLALQPLLGVVFYSPLAGFSLLAYEVS